MLIYKGGGYLVGVPARNLTEEEVKLYGKARLLKSGLYIEDVKASRKFKRLETAEAVVEEI